MRILIVNRALGTLFGGGESFDYQAARQLSLRGHDVTVITGGSIRGDPRVALHDVKAVYLPTLWLRRFAYATEHVHAKLSAAFYHLDNLLFERSVVRWFALQPHGSFDVVQCCSLFDLPRWLLGRYAQPAVSWLPGPPSGRARSRLRALAREPHFGLFTHGTTESSLREMGFPDHSVRIIEPGIDLATIRSASVRGKAARAALGISSDALLGATVARLVPVKNHAMLINAVARARSRGVDWHWLFIGDGPLRTELKGLAEAAGVSGRIHFLGPLSPSEVHRWLSAAVLFVLPSRYESFSIAALEAMAHGLPVIGTDAGYLPKLIARARAGRTVSASDVDDLTQALVDFVDPVVRAQYGAAGRRFAEDFDWERIAGRLESLYCEVVSGRAA